MDACSKYIERGSIKTCRIADGAFATIVNKYRHIKPVSLEQARIGVLAFRWLSHYQCLNTEIGESTLNFAGIEEDVLERIASHEQSTSLLT